MFNMEITFVLLRDFIVDHFDVVDSVINLKVYSLFILHCVQAGELALHPPPELLGVHETAENYRKANDGNSLKAKENLQNNFVKNATVLNC